MRRGNRKLQKLIPRPVVTWIRWSSGDTAIFVRDPTRLLKIVQNKFGN